MFGLVLSLAWSSSAWALDLAEARQVAVERSLQVERAMAEADAARADAGVIAASSLPSVVGFATANTGAGLTAFGFPRPVANQFGVGVSASWSVIDPANWAAASAARSSARGQEAMATWAMVQARREATVAYSAALAAAEEVEAWQTAHADAQQASDAAASLVEAGLRPPSDLAQLKAAEANLYSRLVEAEGRQVARCAELQGLLRVPTDGRCELAPVSWAPPASGTMTHPSLIAAEEAVGAARASHRGAGLDLAPSVALSATAAEYVVTGSDPGPGWSAGAEVSVPLIAGGAGLRGVQSADAELRAATLALEAQERDLEVARLSAEATLSAARAGLEARRQALAAAEEALELVDARYEAGLTGVTEWLDARRVRDDASASLAQAEGALGAALAEVEAARGVY